MDARKLVKMANAISAFFEAEPQESAQWEGISNHLARFWDPRMRREILAHLDQKGGEGMKPVLVRALNEHRAKLSPKGNAS